MANIKISELTELTEIDSGDYIPVVDTSLSETKKISFSNLLTNYYSKDDYAIITGTIETVADSSTGVSVNYPTGFTKDNCVVISRMATGYDSSELQSGEVQSYSYNSFPYSVSNPEVVFLNDSISISTRNSTNIDKEISFKIVLMKIN